MQNKKTLIFINLFLSCASVVYCITHSLNFKFTYHFFVSVIMVLYFLLCLTIPHFQNSIINGAIKVSVLFDLLFFRFTINGGITLVNLSFFLSMFILPVMVLIYCFINTKHQNYKLYFPLIWLSLPLFYLVLTFILVNLNVTASPYYFMNFSLLGVKPMLYLTLIILIVYLLLGYVILLLNKIFNNF